MSVAQSNRGMALLAYLLPLVGSLFVLLMSRKNLFAVYHACQAVAIVLLAVLSPLAWGVVAWAVAWVPLVGPIVAASLFALVIAAYLAVIIAWLFGLHNSLQGKLQPVPIIGGWGDQLFARLTSQAAGYIQPI